MSSNRTYRTVTWDGVVYPSVSALARAKNVTRTTIRRWLALGYAGDDDVPDSQASPIVWNGVQYPSIGQAARDLFVTPQAMAWRIKRGYTQDSDLRW